MQKLTRTGLPVGLFRDRPWERAGVEIRPEDVLVLYTDGITEAMNRFNRRAGDEPAAKTTKKTDAPSARTEPNSNPTSKKDNAA